MAESDNGSCVYRVILITGVRFDRQCSNRLANSLSTEVMQVNETDCYIEEGCLNGYGAKRLVRFTTHIQNIGDLDYYIGVLINTVTTNLNGEIVTTTGTIRATRSMICSRWKETSFPLDSKTDFCVMDLECSGGGTGQYGCGNMGISAGCGDIYGAGLSCQWIDVTRRRGRDVLPHCSGELRLHSRRTRTFREFLREQPCCRLHQPRPVVGVTGCRNGRRLRAIYDCNGVLFGTGETDCNGECGGTALVGDLDNNDAQEYADAVAYVEGILGNDLAPSSCTDIDQDGQITVSDAALMSQCQWYNVAHEHPDSSGFHNKCNFPVQEIVNIYDTVHFMVADVNWNMNYFDVHVLNPDNRIVGYELVSMVLASAMPFHWRILWI